MGAVTPSSVGPYEVLFELAQGGMGTVHLARAGGEPVGASGFERIVSIKRLPPNRTARNNPGNPAMTINMALRNT